MSRQDWQTPKWLIDEITSLYGHIYLDPATSPDNPTGAKHFLTKEDDGLTSPWPYPLPDVVNAGLYGIGPVFLNPPWRDTGKWVDKLLSERTVRWVFVGPASVSAKWFHRMLASADWIGFPHKRIAYVNPEAPDARSSPDRDSVIFAKRFWPYHINSVEWVYLNPS